MKELEKDLLRKPVSLFFVNFSKLTQFNSLNAEVAMMATLPFNELN